MFGLIAPKGGRRVSITESVAAPVGGLNARDAIANMKPTDAIVLENWFCEPTQLVIRDGMTSWATGLPSTVDTIAGYVSATSTKLFAWSSTSVYDISSGGAVGAAVVTSLTNSQWEYTMVGTPAGSYLYAGNGVDKPLLYDGATWVKVDGVSVPAITGVTTTKLRSPITWKNRVWWIEDGSFRVWYLPTQAVGGAASSIDLATYFRRGGQLRVILSATLANGDLLDEYIGFLSTEGELVVFAGNDPAVGAFAIQGLFQLGRPVGRRCWFRLGADAIIICSDGFVPLSKLIQEGRKDESQALSYKILNLVNQDVQQYGANFGWQGVNHALENKVMINVPTGASSARQYVMNPITGAWSVFTGWNARCLEVVQDVLYFGGSTVVYKGNTGSTDNGNAIVGKCTPAFNYFKRRGTYKHFKLVRPIIRSNGVPNPSIALVTDYATTPTASSPTAAASLQATWDTAPWDTSSWTVDDQIVTGWVSVGGAGYAATVDLQYSTNGASVKLQSLDYLFEAAKGPGL